MVQVRLVEEGPPDLGGPLSGSEIAIIRKRDEEKLIISDVMSERFARVIKQKQLDPEKIGEELGFPWMKSETTNFKDGSSTTRYENILPQWLAGKLIFAPSQDQLERLESHLKLEKHIVCTHFQDKFIGKLDLWLSGCGFLRGGFENESYAPTRSWGRNRLVRLYRKKKSEEDKRLAKARRESAKAAEKAYNKKRNDFYGKLRHAAAGLFGGRVVDTAAVVDDEDESRPELNSAESERILNEMRGGA
ncbi:MAG: hypothetical protein ACXACH_03795 [Candidatus Hermodarchaeia archaeon]|jgi:hypothetical protein